MTMVLASIDSMFGCSVAGYCVIPMTSSSFAETGVATSPASRSRAAKQARTAYVVMRGSLAEFAALFIRP
jgi:hypothetical protein